MRFADGTEFAVRADGRLIELLAAPAHYTPDDVAAYALGPVLGVALHLQGAVLLHAAAVVIDGKAVLFAGDAGSGKSTTAAILYRLGYAVLSDDLTEVDGGRAVPSFSAMRLWPEPLHALFGADAAFPDRAPSWEKKVVATTPVAEPREIAAVLFLEGREAAPRLERLAPKDAWRRLLANVYTAKLPGEAMQRRIFDATSSLADALPMYSFAAPHIESAETLGGFLERALR